MAKGAAQAVQTGAVTFIVRHLALTLLLVGCVQSERVVVRGPDGPAVLVTCNDYEACLAEAAEGCPHGYEMLDRNSQTSVGGFVNGGQGLIGTSNKVQMLIRCRSRARASADAR